MLPQNLYSEPLFAAFSGILSHYKIPVLKYHKIIIKTKHLMKKHFCVLVCLDLDQTELSEVILP